VPRIVVTEPIHEDGIALLRAANTHELVTFSSSATDSELAEVLPNTDAVLVRTRPLTAEQLRTATNLKIVSKHGVGCDNIAVAHMNERGLPVAIAADANATSVAEHTMALMLSCAKNLIDQDKKSSSADWPYRHRVEAFELSGKTVLVIGIGRIGKRVSELCQAFGMRVIGYDPFAGTDPHESVDTLEDGLKIADIVTLHIPLSESSQMLIGAEQIGGMKPGAVLINCARGGIIDEAALIEALEARHLSTYGTDVFEIEPVIATDPLLSRPDVVATMHTAAMTKEAKRAMAIQSAQNLLAGMNGTLSPDVMINRRELGL